jgi:peroxiredoxin Q/BCP
MPQAPDFTAPITGGAHFKLSSLRPGKVVLYFYPKDDTSGCTTEALEFTAAVPQFEALGVTVIGVSRDDMKSHEKFVAKHGLGISLVTDDGTICEDYGVWVEKSMYGKKYMGIERATFLIDGKGEIVREWRKVKVAGHVAEVLDAARAL